MALVVGGKAAWRGREGEREGRHIFVRKQSARNEPRAFYRTLYLVQQLLAHHACISAQRLSLNLPPSFPPAFPLPRSILLPPPFFLSLPLSLTLPPPPLPLQPPESQRRQRLEEQLSLPPAVVPIGFTKPAKPVLLEIMEELLASHVSASSEHQSGVE